MNAKRESGPGRLRRLARSAMPAALLSMSPAVSQLPAAVVSVASVSSLAVATLLAFSPASLGAADAPRASVTSSLTVKVSDRDQAAEALIKKTEELEGYFASRNDQAVVLKVPVEQVKTLITFAEGLGLVIERSYETQDLGFDLDQRRTRLASREGMLGKYFAVMKDAGAEGVVQVESEITNLVNEIETLKGSLQLMEHKLRYATVTVQFQFRDRAAPARDGRSSFPWLNTMNLVDLVEDFRRDSKYY